MVRIRINVLIGRKAVKKLSHPTWRATEPFVVGAITSTLFAVFLPVVNDARASHDLSTFLVWLEPLYDYSFLQFFVLCQLLGVICTAALISFGRAVIRYCRRRLPEKIGHWLPTRPTEPIPDSRPAIAVAVAAAVASTLLVFCARHVRIVALHGKSVITWEGPFAEYIGVAVGVGWFLSGAVAILGMHTLSRFRSKSGVFATLAITIGLVNALASIAFCAYLYQR